MTRSTRTSVPGVPLAPSPRATVTAAAARLGLRPLNCAIPMNGPGVWFARRLIATLMAIGGPVCSCELELWRGQLHVFQALPMVVPEADHALARAADFLRAALVATATEKVS
ncbi:hypothetical protein [Nocardia sp. NBC_00508]|uniref:hypothetical protein n=1 Tax=Nocardia sp. NBC_00508 TaxID=2975992 RepID=UPI002E80D738|nr:hypothetical protein [Nocardia sp. NBC_00508]